MGDLCRLIWYALIGLFLPRAALEAEILVLRHQLNVLRRKSPKRLAFGNVDRLVFTVLYRAAPGALDALRILKPQTVIRWHRAGLRAYWRWKSRPCGGRPKIGADIRQLIREMSVANPLRGAPRIHGELLRLGIDVGQTTVAKSDHAIMLRFSWSIHVNTEPAGASFGAYRSNHIFRPEAPRRAAAGSETGLLFDFDDVPPNCFHVLADGAVVGRIMRVIQYRRRQVGVRSADAAARPAISGNGLPPCCRQSHRSRRHRGHRSRHRRPLPHSGQADAGSRPWQRRQRSSPHRSM